MKIDSNVSAAANRLLMKYIWDECAIHISEVPRNYVLAYIWHPVYQRSWREEHNVIWYQMITNKGSL